MKYFTLLILPVALFAAGCGPAKKPYKQYQGISYDQYEQERLRRAAEGLNVEQLHTDGPSFNIEYDEEGNEIIESTGANYGEAVVVMASKKIYLSREGAQKDVQIFQKALDAAYRNVMKEFKPAGFTYSMSPAGAVNPMSIVDVQCILGESDANSRGKETCDFFFKTIQEEYQQLKAE